MSQIIEVKVPDIGDFRDVPIIDLCVKPGDTVKAEDALADWARCGATEGLGLHRPVTEVPGSEYSSLMLPPSSLPSSLQSPIWKFRKSRSWSRCTGGGTLGGMGPNGCSVAGGTANDR